jgi:hypothetical protein
MTISTRSTGAGSTRPKASRARADQAIIDNEVARARLLLRRHQVAQQSRVDASVAEPLPLPLPTSQPGTIAAA